MESLDIDKLKSLDHEWQQIEASYRLGPYNAPINFSQEKSAMLSAFTASETYNPLFEYKPAPEFPIQRIQQFILSLRPQNSLFESMYYSAAQNELLMIQAVLTHSPSIITGHTSLIYGIPDNELIENARLILTSPFSPLLKDDYQEEPLSAEETALRMQDSLEKIGLTKWTAQLFSPMNAKVLVSRLDKLIKVREDATFSPQDLHRLLVHEIGVHVVRAENGDKQPIGIFSRGLPGYLDTEEGLAVYSEERAGVIETTTMRKYAARVIAAHAALSQSFSDVFYNIAPSVGPDTAFEVVARAKRGFRDTSQPGSHTKDIVYLNGYKNVRQHLKEHPADYEILFAGKFGLQEIGLVKDLIEQGIFTQPALTPAIFFQKEA